MCLEHKIFVYGTLMAGEANNRKFMSGAKFEGRAILEDYAMFELGSYPAILPVFGEVVKGEVYIITEHTLKELHFLEGEGELYRYNEVLITYETGKQELVGTYVYCRDIEQKNIVPHSCQPWCKGWQNDLVWYACYGSNLLKERFLHYIQGGVCRFNNKEYKKCSDTTNPRDSQPICIPYPMYFGNCSRTWSGSGVCFLDTSKEGVTLGRMYLITREQMDHIHEQEGCSKEWYDKTVEMGFRNSIRIVTISNSCLRSKNPPTENYMEVVKLGLRETYPKMTEKEIAEYLKSCLEYPI